MTEGSNTRSSSWVTALTVVALLGWGAIWMKGYRGADVGNTAATIEQVLKATPQKSDDEITLSVFADTTLVDIRSPSGIGAVELQTTAKSWPDKILVRLHLKGLESVHIATPTAQLSGSVSSNREPAQFMEFNRTGEAAAPIDNKSQYWTEIGIFAMGGQPRRQIPLENGYFELLIPPALYQENPPSIRIEWIDFYRN